MRTALQIITIISLLTLTGCATRSGIQSEKTISAHYAFMNIEWDGYSSAAKIWQQGAKLRMEVLGGRKSNIMLVDYLNDKALVLIPGEGKYQQFPIERLNQSLPHFFDPQVKLEKTYLADATISGHPAKKYNTRAIGRSGKQHSGTLWISREWPDFPLKWVADNNKITVTWEDLELQQRTSDWFRPPAHFQNLNATILQPLK